MLAVKLPTTTAFSVGWKLALLLKIPTWGSGIRDSQILELEPVQRLRCRVSQSTPFMLALLFCTANGDISSMNHELLITKAKPPQETLNKTCQHPSPNSLPFGAAQWGTCSSCSQCTKPAALLRKGNRRGSDRMLHQGTSAFNSTMKTSPTTQTLIAASLYNTIVSSCSSQCLFSWLQCKANNYEKRDAFSNSSLLFSSGAWLNGFINLYPVTQATYPSTCASKWKPGFDSATSVSELLSFPRCRQ